MATLTVTGNTSSPAALPVGKAVRCVSQVVDFSEFTKISCDTNGHYFNFDFSCLSRGRLYKFILKLEHGGIRKKYDNKLAFMITN